MVTGKGATRWARGHPWIYRSDVRDRPEGPAGSVLVEDPRGRALGRALWSPASEIALRMLTRDARPIDAAFWSGRIGAAVARRHGLDCTGWRAVHGEADGLPSLIADVLDRYVVVLAEHLVSADQYERIVHVLAEAQRPAVASDDAFESSQTCMVAALFR